ncbi:MAG: alanine racemase [Candidatus Schmidhempelia sp.]|nr:alanine racemase [Candidatus Schmidhempelia sp.]
MSIATIEVDLLALRHNIKLCQAQAPNCQLAAVVKANAYGHGMIEIARFLQGNVDYFAVARLNEALQLRRAGVNVPILILAGFIPQDNISLFERYALQPVIHCPEQIAMLQNLKTSHPLKVWFKLDTGMHRLGFRPEDAVKYFNQLLECVSVAKPINLISHFCNADLLKQPDTASQIAVFDSFISALSDVSLIGLQSLAASGGQLAWPTSYRDVIRPGLALYGVSPFSYHEMNKGTGTMLGLKPAMTLKSELIAIRKHLKGEGIGYGQTWYSQRDTHIGVVAMGYGDGYPRNIPNGTPVLINGQRKPIVGRVAMDMIMVDLGADNQYHIGDEVIFWNKDLPVEEIADITGISAYELLTRLTTRSNIIYKK